MVEASSYTNWKISFVPATFHPYWRDYYTRTRLANKVLVEQLITTESKISWKGFYKTWGEWR